MLSAYPLKSGASLTGQWRGVNGVGNQTAFRGNEIVGLVGHAPSSSSNGRQRRTFQLEGQFPFRIYQLPSWYRAAPNPATDWLKFCVRAGYVTLPLPMTLITTGTDGEQFGYDETFPVASGAGVNEVSLPSGVALNYFWLDAGTSAVSHGASPPSNSIIIGYVDTTNTTALVPRIRQIQFGDILGGVYCT